MRARGSGLKKDTHSVTGSDPGETPANPEVSGKRNLELHRICFYCTARKILRSLRVLKANRQKPVFLETSRTSRKPKKRWSGDLFMLLLHLTAWHLRHSCSCFLPKNIVRKHLWLSLRLVWMHYWNWESFHKVQRCVQQLKSAHEITGLLAWWQRNSADSSVVQYWQISLWCMEGN